jgi:hypothetical protein
MLTEKSIFIVTYFLAVPCCSASLVRLCVAEASVSFYYMVSCFFVNLHMVILKRSIFDSGNTDFGNSKIPSSTEIKTKPDGWESTSRGQDGSIWEISQREEDILLQEFERRIAFSKQQVQNIYFPHCFLLN